MVKNFTRDTKQVVDMDMELDTEKQPFLPSDDQISHNPSTKTNSRPFSYWSIVACISILCNIALTIRLNYPTQYTERSVYANLPRNEIRQFNTSSKYGLATQEPQRSILWESLDASAGEIALPNAFAHAKGLPDATPFHWDNTRSIYLVNGYHSLHCLRKLRRSIVLSHYNMSQLDPYPHLVHCMDHLLQNILCEADDTPMYTSAVPNSKTGNGQQRTCRSWDSLQKWVDSQSSCFAYINETQGVDVELKRFRYCDKGMPADGKMRSHFGLDETWSGRKPADIESMPRYWENFPLG